MMCTRLYAPVRQTAYLEYKCEEMCKCVNSKKCPDANALRSLLINNHVTGAVKAARDEFVELICQYTHVFIAKIESIEANSGAKRSKKLELPTIRFRVEEQIVGGKH